MKVYIRAESKKSLNERIKAGENVGGVSYNPWGGEYHELKSLPEGTVIAVFNKVVSGTPYAKTWGTWHPSKNIVK